MGEISRMRRSFNPEKIDDNDMWHVDRILIVEPTSGLIEIISHGEIEEWYANQRHMPSELLNRSRYELRARSQIRRQEAPALIRVLNNFSGLSASV